MAKRFTLLFFIITISFNLSAQIMGLSGSKLGSMTVDVVDHKKIEFEPSFFHVRSYQYWDNSGNLQNLYSTDDSVKVITGIGFRFTYGLWDKIELGMAVSTDVSAAAFSARYAFLQKEKYGVAIITGLNVPLGNRTVDQTIRATGNIANFGFGVVASYAFTDNLSVDFTGQYSRFLKETSDHDRGGFYLNTDVGYYILKKNIQLVGAIGYHSVSNDIGSHQVLTVNPGITIETSKNFIIVLSAPFDVYGRRENKNIGFSFALTLTFD